VQVSLAPQLRLADFFISTSGFERQQIFVPQLVVALPKPGWIGCEFADTQIWSLLDAYMVLQEKCQISGYHQPHNEVPIFNAIELVRTCAVVLIEAHVSQLHKPPPFQAGWSQGLEAAVRVLHNAVAVAAFCTAGFATGLDFFAAAFR
jgi:hypothetical protein